MATETELVCPCCLEDLGKVKITALTCSHVFHDHCLNLYIKSPFGRSRRCPLCRSNFSQIVAYPDSNSDVIDWDGLVRIVNNDLAFLEELLCEDYIAEIRTSATKISASVSIRDAQCILRYSECLKGCAIYLFSNNLRDSCFKLQKAARGVLLGTLDIEETWRVIEFQLIPPFLKDGNDVISEINARWTNRKCY